MNTVPYFPRPLATVAPRDLLLAERLGLKRTDMVLEIGTGSGSSLFRLAPAVSAYHGVDIAQQPVERLRREVQRQGLENVDFFVRDFCRPGAAATLPCQYDVVFSCDTLEHVEQPGQFLENVHAAIKPGGRLLLTYPNEHPRRAHGITFFERRSELLELLVAAGFAVEQVQIDELQMTRRSNGLLSLGWELPRKLSKKAVELVIGPTSASEAPQTFDETHFFALADRFERWAPLINAYCWAVLKAMDMAGPVYRSSPAGETIWDQRILIQATRCATAALCGSSPTEPAAAVGRFDTAEPVRA